MTPAIRNIWKAGASLDPVLLQPKSFSQEKGAQPTEHNTVLPGHMNLPKIPIPSWEAAQSTAPRSHASAEHILNTLLSRAEPGRGFEGLSLPREGYFCDLSHQFL